VLHGYETMSSRQMEGLVVVKALLFNELRCKSTTAGE